jgi:hypothetical protein
VHCTVSPGLFGFANSCPIAATDNRIANSIAIPGADGTAFTSPHIVAYGVSNTGSHHSTNATAHGHPHHPANVWMH